MLRGVWTPCAVPEGRVAAIVQRIAHEALRATKNRLDHKVSRRDVFNAAGDRVAPTLFRQAQGPGAGDGPADMFGRGGLTGGALSRAVLRP